MSRITDRDPILPLFGFRMPLTGKQQPALPPSVSTHNHKEDIMSDKPENKPEKTDKPVDSLNNSLAVEDYRKAMQSEKNNVNTSASSLPDLEIFTSTDVKPVVEQNFDKWDADKNGKLSKDELNAVLDKGDTSVEEKTAAGLQRAFDSMDLNEDGGLDKKEFEDYYKAAEVYERTRERVDAVSEVIDQHFDQMDQDHNRVLTRGEILKAGNNEAISMTDAERQLLREFGNGDAFKLLAGKYDRNTMKRTHNDDPNGMSAISEKDIDSAGRRLKLHEVEGQNLYPPGVIHDMYNPAR